MSNFLSLLFKAVIPLRSKSVESLVTDNVSLAIEGKDSEQILNFDLKFDKSEKLKNQISQSSELSKCLEISSTPGNNTIKLILP